MLTQFMAGGPMFVIIGGNLHRGAQIFQRYSQSSAFSTFQQLSNHVDASGSMPVPVLSLSHKRAAITSESLTLLALILFVVY